MASLLEATIRMVVEVRGPTERNGYSIEHLATVHPKRVVVSHTEDSKLFFEDGVLALDYLSNSSLYGAEIQLVYYTRRKPAIIPQRVNGHNGYFRVEICMSPEEAVRLLKSVR